MPEPPRLTRLETHRAATCSFQLITPDTARQYLANLGPERTLSRQVVDKYASAMQHGAWREYHPDPVILNTQGQLLNAQHRLSAIARTGKSYYMLVVHYHDDAYTMGLEMTLDRGKTRSTRDVLTLGCGRTVTMTESAVARHMYWGIQPSSKVIPDKEFVAFFRQWYTQIATAIRLLSPRRKRLTLAPVMAACARALITEADEGVGRFAQVLMTGESLSKRELTIIALRHWLLARQGGLSSMEAADVYARTTFALRAYMDKREQTQCAPAKRELFALEA